VRISRCFSAARAASAPSASCTTSSGVELHLLELDLSSLQFRRIEDVVDDREEGLRAVAQHGGEPALLGRDVGLEQQRVHAEDAVHRRADLVAHVGEEFALGPVRTLRLILRGRELLLPTARFGDVDVERDVARLVERAAVDLEDAVVRAGPLHADVASHAQDAHSQPDARLGVGVQAELAARRHVAQRILDRGAGAEQVAREFEEFQARAVARDDPQVGIGEDDADRQVVHQLLQEMPGAVRRLAGGGEVGRAALKLGTPGFELAAGEAKLDLVHHLRRQPLEDLGCVRPDVLPRLRVRYAERPDPIAGRGGERGAGVEAQALIHQQRVVAEALVAARVADEADLILQDGVGAEGRRARRLVVATPRRAFNHWRSASMSDTAATGVRKIRAARSAMRSNAASGSVSRISSA
jgi:hypothetical protein